jgi:hypothetical protein
LSDLLWSKVHFQTNKNYHCKQKKMNKLVIGVIVLMVVVAIALAIYIYLGMHKQCASTSDAVTALINEAALFTDTKGLTSPEIVKPLVVKMSQYRGSGQCSGDPCKDNNLVNCAKQVVHACSAEANRKECSLTTFLAAQRSGDAPPTTKLPNWCQHVSQQPPSFWNGVSCSDIATTPMCP